MSFWTESRRDTFRDVLKVVCEVLDISGEDIEDYVRRHAHRYDIVATISKRTVERFLGNQSTTRTNNLDAMLVSLSDDINEWANLPEADRVRINALFLLKADWEQSQNRNTTHTSSPKTLANNDAARQVSSVTDILLSYLHLPKEASRECAELFFRDTDDRKVHFETYRYTSDEQLVQKSFTVVHRPTETIPVVRFANFFEFESRTRSSSGILLKFAKEVLFFGQSDKGQSAKSLVFNHIAGAQDRYTGLALTNEPNGDTVAARFVMLRTAFEHHSSVNTGCFSIDDEAIGLDQDSKERLRNRVKFSLEEEIFDAENKYIPQKNMVVKVDEMISEGKLSDGRRLGLKFSDGRRFNPADHDFYTFNSALKIRD